MKIVPKKIERYCRENTTPESPLLRELVAETYTRTAFPEMQVGHLEGAFLRMLVRLLGAKRVLELGTFTGYSSLVMAEALPEDGELITCDIDPQVTEIAKKGSVLNPMTYLKKQLKWRLIDTEKSFKKGTPCLSVSVVHLHAPSWLFNGYIKIT